MSQEYIRAAFYRGGSSKGVFFYRADVPADREALDRLLIAVLSNPDPCKRQLNGMGGGVSSLSKAAIIGPSTHPEADVARQRSGYLAGLNTPIASSWSVMASRVSSALRIWSMPAASAF